MSLQPDQFQASVPMTLSSLLPHSQIVGILFTAFSHPSEGEAEERMLGILRRLKMYVTVEMLIIIS